MYKSWILLLKTDVFQNCRVRRISRDQIERQIYETKVCIPHQLYVTCLAVNGKKQRWSGKTSVIIILRYFVILSFSYCSQVLTLELKNKATICTHPPRFHN
ncbi:unnamed protein product [Rangifer tarandus platyrhynchus]|uniref:Uncharacterized protein n=1 Tax=Rangifer tarandus platyrhynchus TaxID=3082113 RepID=A0AC59Z2I3_RANTA